MTFQLVTEQVSVSRSGHKILGNFGEGFITLIAQYGGANFIADLAARVQIGNFASISFGHKGSGRTNAPERSVDTPVAKRPFDATANEPPRSTVVYLS